MPQRKSKATAQPNWALQLREELSAKTREPKGTGWLTCDEFGKTLGISRRLAREYLRRGMAMDKIEKFRGTQKTPDGINHQTWYRKKDKT